MAHQPLPLSGKTRKRCSAIKILSINQYLL
jgi:hypothetical protein